MVIKRKLKSEDIKQMYSNLDSWFSSDESESKSESESESESGSTSNSGSDSESEEINKKEIIKMLNLITKELKNQKIEIQEIGIRIKKLEKNQKKNQKKLESKLLRLHRFKPPNSD